MITERQAELLRRCSGMWSRLECTFDRLEMQRLQFLSDDHTYFTLTPAGRSALAEFDAAKMEGEQCSPQ